MADLCSIAVGECRDRVVLRLVGELDMSNAAIVADDVGALHDKASNGVVLDLDELAYVDSAGLAALDRLLRERPMPVVLADDATIRETLAVAGFDKVRPVYAALDSIPDA